MSTAKKPTKTTAKPAAATRTKAPPVKSPVVTAAATSEDKPEKIRDVLRKKELVDAVVARSGIKKKDAKPVVEAMLAELGEALAAGRELILPPLGRTKLNRERVLDDGRVMIVKIRQKNQPQIITHTPAAAE